MSTHEDLKNFPSKEHVFILPDEVLDAKKVKLINLKNPHTEKICLFIVDYDHAKLYETLSFNEKYRSWIISNSVIADGSLKIGAICNPVYLVLPYLLKASKSNRNFPLDQLLIDEEFPEMVLLCDIIEDLSCIADRKGSADLNVWSYNEKSTLEWLQHKAENLATTLQKKRERTSQGVSVVLNSTVDCKDAYLELACGIISEYLCEEISTLLRKHLKLPEREKKEKENLQQNISSKKIKLIDTNHDESFAKSTTISKAKLTKSAKEKELAKSAKGTKSITSFFSKKT